MNRCLAQSNSVEVALNRIAVEVDVLVHGDAEAAASQLSDGHGPYGSGLLVVV